uniref:Uncharacterized protein n=1 Tax=Trypanosoma vivax (strain Y486) TaxID=1055687 RepID=G0TTL1_TRYVY|nr:hypothetical protein TVY486_0304630 [Trypanosoma vivax Y486]
MHLLWCPSHRLPTVSSPSAVEQNGRKIVAVWVGASPNQTQGSSLLILTAIGSLSFTSLSAGDNTNILHLLTLLSHSHSRCSLPLSFPFLCFLFFLLPASSSHLSPFTQSPPKYSLKQVGSNTVVFTNEHTKNIGNKSS